METTASRPDPALATGEAPEEAAVRTLGLYLRLDDRAILSDICLRIPPGRTVALLGANGAGKSTLLRVLATLLAPTKGRLELFGQAGAAGAVRARSRIGLIMHSPMLYRDLTAKENLVFFGRLYGVAGPGQRASRMLRLVGMDHRADDAVKTLSRGMTQRVAIARALMHDPDLLLADEPFNGLDAPSAEVLEALLGRLRESGKTVILANHDIRQSLSLADTVLVLRQGRVALHAPVGRLSAEAVLEELTGP